MLKSPQFTLRAASAADSSFAYGVKKEALGEYVTKTWGWDETFQSELHSREFDPANLRIVVLDGIDVGTLEVYRRSDHIDLSAIYLLPAVQNKGIGTLLIRDLIAEARRQRLPLRLQFLKVNPVRKLYERLGFQVTGEREHHIQMEYAGATTSGQSSQPQRLR
jgi:GNAT superfamily N-acetyltransferase